MKIVLINLPSPFETEPAMNPPLGLGYISSYLKIKGYSDVTIVDYALYKDYDYINERRYFEKIPLDGDIYGFSCVTPQYKWLYELTKYIRFICPSAILIAGGPHPSNMPKECLNECGLDYVVQGEGEIVFFRIVEHHSQNHYFNYPNILEEPVINLGCLPLPDRPNMELYKRNIDGQKAAHIITLRGCPYNCYFCDRESVGRNVRYRSIENVISEVDELRQVHGINSFVIYDDIFTLSEYRVYHFCNALAVRGSSWRCWSRTDRITEKLLTYMKKCGLKSITFGVESGDDDILKNINKVTTAEQNKKALLAAKKAGVPVRCSLMYGNPGETLSSLNNTLKFVEETQPDEWNLAVLTPIPGSEFWSNPQKYGLSFDKAWLKKKWYLPCNRFGETGVGDPWITIDSMSKQEFTKNLVYFVNELERICPRKKIQDTIQEIKLV